MRAVVESSQGLAFKDLATIVLSIIALLISIIGVRRASIERQRVFRTTLTDTLNRVMESQIDFVKLRRENKEDPQFLEALAAIYYQKNGFLLEQATFISSKIPDLVGTFELNTIAISSAQAGNFKLAEQNYKRAVQHSTRRNGLLGLVDGIFRNRSDVNYWQAQATASYAWFLYSQNRVDEGRDQYKKALELVTGESSPVHYLRGDIYTRWAVSELQFNRSSETAERFFTKAREEFGSIDIKPARDAALAGLERKFRHARAQQQPMPMQQFTPPPESGVVDVPGGTYVPGTGGQSCG